jgi:outer membrane protein assembly factor BamB
VARRSDDVDASPAEIVREYGPFPDVAQIGGVTFDGKDVWFAAGNRMQSFDPDSGKPGRALPVRAEAGSAYDGRYLYQIAGNEIQKVDPASGAVVATVPAPPGGSDAGLTWAEGTLWLGKHKDRKIHQLDPQTGKVLRTLESARFVTGVTFLGSELWHGTWEDESSDLRRIDPRTGEVLERIAMPEGVAVTGLESSADGVFYCGGGNSRKVRAVRRPRKKR